MKVYDQVTKIVTDKFYDRTFRGLPWTEYVSAYRLQLSSRSSDEALEFVLNDLLANLHASHTEFVSSSDQEFHGLESIFSGQIAGDRIFQIGVWFNRIGSKWFARCVFPGSVAEKAGLKSGDEIVAVDGKALEPVESFATGAPVRIAFRRLPDSSPQAIEVSPALEGVQESLYKATLLSNKVYRINGKRIGYFHLWSGTHQNFLDALQSAAAKMAESTDAMILDLRDGFGGADSRFTLPFLTEDESGKAQEQIYKKPVVFLINDGVRSGKEWIAHIFKQKKRGLLVGTTTAGHVLSGSFTKIVDGKFDLLVAVEDGPASDVEGHGVAPDVFVPSPIPYSHGRDPQLKRALEILGAHSP